ncbi:MAG: hypothetical protein U9R40_04835 [Synergistota bacterium]|nr:hypothetical protein [Synergistota bacterium]
MTANRSASYIEGGSGSQTPEKWPFWPQPSYLGSDYEPLTFMSINRDIMAWVESDKTPESSVWGCTLKMVNFAGDSSILEVAFPATQRYRYGVASNATLSVLSDSCNSSMEDTRFIVPKQVESWLTLQNGQTVANQQFTNSIVEDWVSDWIDFIKEDTKADLPLADSGHASPVVVWPDNIWLEPLSGYAAFSQAQASAYAGYGGALIFLPTTDGVVHAFDVDPDDDGYFQEKWGIIPLASFLFGVYQEEYRQIQELSACPRIPMLGAPILIHDVEDEDADDGWVRLLVGATGTGVELAYKAAAAWDLETGLDVSSELASPASASGHAAGVFALDITDPEYDGVTQRWSVTNAYWGSADGAVIVCSSATGDAWRKKTYSEIDAGAISRFAGYRSLKMSLSRPVAGYTGTPERTWHTIILGIDTSDKFHLYDIDPLTGELLDNIQLSETAASGTEIDFPSKIGALVPWGESTPKLEEVYFYLSNGSFYSWNPDTGSDPQSLVEFSFKLQGDYYNSEVIQDFDGTFLMVDGDVHRFVAFVVRMEKAGAGQGGGDIYGAILVDVTKLAEEADSLPESIEIGRAWGDTNEFNPENDSESVYSMYLSEQMHGNETFPVSPPFFYDGKLIIATTGYLNTGQQSQRGYVSNVYIADPLTHDVQQIDTLYHTKLVGGAGVDSEGVLHLPTSDGDMVDVDLTQYGLNEPGAGGVTSGDIDSVYWRIVD